MKDWAVGDWVRGPIFFTDKVPASADEAPVVQAVVQAEIEGHPRLAWVKCAEGERALMRDPQLVRGEA